MGASAPIRRVTGGWERASATDATVARLIMYPSASATDATVARLIMYPSTHWDTSRHGCTHWDTADAMLTRCIVHGLITNYSGACYSL
jgi:hypothetical protein